MSKDVEKLCGKIGGKDVLLEEMVGVIDNSIEEYKDELAADDTSVIRLGTNG